MLLEPRMLPVAAALVNAVRGEAFSIRLGTKNQPIPAKSIAAQRRLDLGDQSSLMPASRMTLPHFLSSSVMNFPNSWGVIRIGSTPKSASRALAAGSASAALIAPLSLPTMSAGVSFGAQMPYQPSAS